MRIRTRIAGDRKLGQPVLSHPRRAGVNPERYSPYPEGSDVFLNWSDVKGTAAFIKASSMTRMTVHMARAIREALLYKEKHGKDPEFSETAGKLANQLTSEIWRAETARP